MTTAGRSAGWTPRDGGMLAFAAAAVCGLCALPAAIEWPVVALAVLAASSCGLAVELRGSQAHVRFSAAHAVLFGCAITLGPYGALIPSSFVGACRVISRSRQRASERPSEDYQSYGSLRRLLHDLLGPSVTTTAAAVAYVGLGGSLILPHSVDSVGPLMAAGLAYAMAGAILFWAGRATGTARVRGPAGVPAVAAGWALSLVAGYVLAIVYATAPVYAIYAVSAASVCTTWALARTPRAHRGVAVVTDSAAGASPATQTSTYVDSATGLANRRYLDLFLDREIGRSQRFGKPVAVAVFNIDGYRALDEQTGCEAMQEVGRSLAAGIREYDIAARHSDGRFVLVLPETPIDSALEVVDRLRKSAAAINLHGQTLSVSVGLAAFPEHGTTAEDILNAAHYALNRGRSEQPDRVHLPESLAKAS